MKRTICLLTSCALLFTLAACGNSNAPSAETNSCSSKTIQDRGQSSPDGNAVPAASEGSRPLIVYFTVDETTEPDAISSASVVTIDGEEKGRVRAVADMIAAETDGDLFSLTTTTTYPADGRAVIGQAAEEQDENARPELTAQIENLNDYDTVFVGFPTWWYDMPMALYSFFDEYDLSGKTVIPFNTHNGSRFSGTIDTIRELEPGANVVTDGFTVSENNVADAAPEVTEWLRSLGY